MKFNRSSQYRLYSLSQGVIGPSSSDSDQIFNINSENGHWVIEWSTFGVQKISSKDLELQEFSESQLDWDRKIENIWHDLLKYKSNNTFSHKPKFILLSGLPGSGKTSLSKKISSNTGWLHFDFSEFAYKVIGHHPLMHVDYIEVGSRIEKKIKEYISSGMNIIYDTTAITTKMRKHHFSIIDNICETYLIYVPTDPNICLQRVSLRQPASTIDLRMGIYRSDMSHIRTFCDFVNDFEPPENYILGDNEQEVNKILFQLGVYV